MPSLLTSLLVASAALGGPAVVVKGHAISSSTPSLSSNPPRITPAPSVGELDWLIRRQDPDALSLAKILLTAVPAYVRQVAATDLPAASSLIRDDFSHGQRPYWFNQLPEDIQSYLIKKFGPPTAIPSPPLSNPSASGGDGASATLTETTTGRPSEASSSASDSSDVSSSTSSGAVTATSSIATRTSSRPSAQSTSTRTSSEISPSRTSSHQSSSPFSIPSPSTSPDPSPDSPPVSSSGLSKSQKIGLGVGIPVSIVGAAAIFMGCCFLLRRRREKKMDGSIPPSSPGFIPHFAFQDRSMETVEHRTPLTRHDNTSTHDLGHSSWEDEGVDPMERHNPYTIGTLGPPSNPYKLNYNSGENSNTNHYHEEIKVDNSTVSYSNPGVSIHNPAPIRYSPDSTTSPQDLAPITALHTHSSNRARGRRRSYTSLRSVTEVSEPDDNANESPVLGRHASPKQAAGRSLIPHSPPSAIKRKPVGSPPLSTTASTIGTSPAAAEASQKLLRQAMPEHSGSSSSGLALSTSTANTSTSSYVGASTTVHPNTDPVSPISPLSNRVPSNPFTYDYIEDYGPEYYHGGYYTNVDVDAEEGLYGANGGNTSLSHYPTPEERRRKSSSSRTEWPLRNLIGSGHRRKSSPLWDRIYEE